jgi:hypothetical protein
MRQTATLYGRALHLLATPRDLLQRKLTMSTSVTTARYAKVIDVSKRVRWEIDRDLIRGRRFDYGKTFLPSGLSLVDELPF